MLVTETADGFRHAVGTPRSLDHSEGVSFNNFSLPENSLLRLWGKRMPEGEIPMHLAAFHVNVQVLMQILAKGRDQDLGSDSSLTQHFIVPVP